ncbi:hypothetical protein LCGC14_1037490, partial [marine sediment metagenome]
IMSRAKYVIGIDFGTDSVRVLVVNAETGKEESEAAAPYLRWAEARYCDPANNRFRQHPLDYVESLERAVRGALTKLTPEKRNKVIGIGIDTTGSTPCAVDRQGTPLALKPEFKDNPDAMFVLWKDHTAIKEADQINQLARNWGGTDFTAFEGGIYSSEWFWAKILHVLRSSTEVREAAYSWVEHCDWLPALLTGNTDPLSLKRSRCAAGHKAMWHESWGGLPPKEFLGLLHPYAAELRDRLYDKTYTSDEVAGHLSAEWAEKLGLTTNTVIAVGTFDAHSGAVGAKIDEYALVRVMGTSTCDIIVAKVSEVNGKTIRGICGQVDGSVIPGLIGLEAGQSAFGDLLAWFKDVLSWPIDNLVMTSDILSDKQKEELKNEIASNFISKLSDAAEAIPLSESIPTALDWINGRRTPDADQNLKSAISHLSLGTKAPHIFKALINAICLGSKKIADRFQEEGIRIESVVGIGGVARKSPFIMQTLANIMNMPIKVAESDQAPALGAAIYAAVASNIYPNVAEASKNMGSAYEAEYLPKPQRVQDSAYLIESYDRLGAFMETIAKKN